MVDGNNKARVNFGLGQHIDLSQTMPEQALLADSTVYGFTSQAAVAFAKGTDEMLLDAIIQKAKEHGITDLYVLNEDFIVSAIREKMERESERPHGRYDGFCCSNCGRPVATDCWGGGMDANNYCYFCGAKMDDPKGD